MRFGSVDLFMDFGDWQFRMGRPIANEGFLKSLLTYGRFDTYQFFCPDVHHMERFRDRIEELIPDPVLQGRVETTLQIALAETIREQEFQVFHLGDFTYFMPYLIGIRDRVARAPFPITGVTHSIDGIFMNSRYLELLLAGLAPFDGIICSSLSALWSVEKGLAWVQNQLKEKTGANINAWVSLKHIPLGIEESLFQEEEKQGARAFFHIPADAVVVLSVGRLSLRQKTDWSPTLELLSRMAAQGEMENVILLMAGGGLASDISILESMINRLGLQKKVHLFPNFKPEVKTKLYQTADFYLSIVDNFQETFGLSVLEAMASGLPVVISDFSGYREFVTQGQEGFLIPTTWAGELPEFLWENMGILDPSVTRLYLSQTVAVDLEKLRTAIIQLSQDKELRARMGQKARTKGFTYRWSNIIPAYEAFWANLKKEAQRRPLIRQRIPDILVGDPGGTFSHFPSRRLAGEHIVSLTEMGQQVLASSAHLTRYEDVQACLFPDLEVLLLSSLSSQPRSVESLRQMAGEALEATRGQVDFHILWLLKHGALKIEIQK